MSYVASSPARLLVYLLAAVILVSPARADLGCEGASPGGDPALACTIDADTTVPALIAQAQALGGDPDQILDFVRTRIGFESYRGSLRGALGTLWSGAGNALDKANLAIALLRAAGVPARYVRGTLDDAQRAALIASMFPNPTRVVGCPLPGTPRANPMSDADLLAETGDHFWIEVRRGATFEAVELSVPGAPAIGDVGQRAAVFDEVPDALRHHVTLRLLTEITGTGLSLGRRTTPVIEQRFPTVVLVGRPATFGHYEVQAASGGLFGSGIFTYQPYLLIDGEVIGHAPLVLPGVAYQEVFLGVMQEFVSLLAVQFDLEAPDGTIEHHERTLVDRLGPAARDGSTTATLAVPDGTTPVVTEMDLLTVNVLPGAQGLDPIAAQESRIAPIAAEFTALLPTLTQIAAQGVAGPTDTMTLRRGNELASALIRLASQTLTMSMGGAADRALRQLERGFLMRSYFDAPRLLVAVSRADATGVRLKLDLRRTAARSIPYPGQVADQASRFEFVRGLLDSAIETELMRSVTTGTVHSTTALFAALPDGVGVELIDATTAALLDTLAITDDAKARIRAALAAGNSVLVPRAMVPFDGGNHVAWFEIDGRTNYPIGVTEDGGHQAAIGYSLLIRNGTDAGVLIPGFANGFTGGILSFLGTFIGEYSGGASFEAAVRAGKQAMDDVSRTVRSQFGGYAKKGLFVGFTTAKWYVSFALPTDPAVQPFLSTPFDAVVAPPQSANGVDVAVRRDEGLFVDVDGAELPTVYRAAVRNKGAAQATVALDFDTTLPGFTTVQSLPQLTLAAGEVGEVGVCLFPQAGVPAAGVGGDVSATAVGPNASGGDALAVQTPSVHGVAVTAAPATISGAPGTGVVVDLAIASTGNTTELAPTIATAPAGWTVQGVPASVSLTAGEVRHLPVTIVIPAGALPGTTATIALGADICAGVPAANCPLQPPSARVETVTVLVRSAEVATLANAGACADTHAFPALGAALNAVADAAAVVQADPADGAACRALRARTAQLCPLLQSLSMLDGIGAALCATPPNAPCDAGTVPALSQQLAALCPTLAQRIEATLVPGVTYAAPGTTAASVLRLRAVGSAPVTVAVALDQAAGGLDVGGATLQVPLAAGAIADVPLSLLANAEGRYPFVVRASVVTAPLVTTTVRGVHQATRSVVNVMSVTATPPYVFAGGTARISAAVANTVNTPLSARARVVVRRPNGDVQYQSPASTPVALPAGGSLIDLQLDDVTATGWNEDLYRVEVQLTALDGTPLPGGAGEGHLPVGVPVRARIAADPVLVPPGTSEVNARITVESTLPAGGVAGAAQPTDPTVDRIDWAATSRGASLSGRSPFISNAAGEILLDERPSGTELYVGNYWTQAQAFVVDLGQLRNIDTVQFHLWDGDDRFYRYTAEVSADGGTWIPVADATTGEHRGVKRLTFAAVDARYVRIAGTYASIDVGLYLIDEVLVIGDAAAVAEPTTTVVVDAATDAGPTSAAGRILRLNAGTYAIKHVGGAISLYPNDSDNGGRTWTVDLRVEVPVLNKSYRIGHVHDALTLYDTAAAAETANLGRSFTLYLPVQADVAFFVSDAAPADNRGSQSFEVRQLSGPDDRLVARMRDAVMRGALWEQPAIASWQNWVSATDYGCMGCHEQTQASVGLEVSRRKLPDTPVDERLRTAFVAGYKTWQDAEGWVSPQHGGAFKITQTSLWAWAVSQFRDDAGDDLAAPLLRALDWLVGAQGADGGWVADNDDANASKLYADGIPSATQTAAVIQALTRALDLTDAQDVIPFADVTITGNRVAFARNPGFEVDLLLAPADAVSGVRLSITDSFTGSKNFVLGEIEFFDGDQKIPVSATVADLSQGLFPIASTVDGISRDPNNGWAHLPEAVSAATPAEGVWTFAAPHRIDRIRIHQPYRFNDEHGRGHQLKDYTVDLTGDAVPALNGSFVPASIQQAGLRAPARRSMYLDSVRRAARLLAGAGWDYARNTRTTAQTVIGLQAALPWLDAVDRSAAELRLADAEARLRATQQSDGGWPDVTGPSRVFQSAQALEALVERNASTVDPAVVAGAEFLLLTQRPDGRWLSPPLSAETPGATTWVQIALPTIFENLSGLTLDVTHHVPSAGNAVVDGSIVPLPSERTVVGAATRLRWNAVLLGSEPTRAFAVRSRVTDMQPGEIRTIGTDSTVAFASLAGDGTIALPPLTVAARHILSIAPPIRTTTPGGLADYLVTVENVRDSDDTFTLAVLGLAPGRFTLPATVPVPAGQSVTVPLQVAVPADAAESDLDLRVIATSAQGTLDEAGAAVLVRGNAATNVIAPLQAVHVAIAPDHVVAGRGMTVETTVRVTNLGDAAATFDLSTTVPPGVTAQLAQPAITILPGVGNARSVTLRLTGPADLAAPASVPFTVHAVASGQGGASGEDTGTLDLLTNGVDVSFEPASTTAPDTVLLHVRNTGVATDSFTLALSGPLAGGPTPAALLAQSTVGGLAPGTETTVPVTIAPVPFATAGALPLTAIATSTGDPRVSDRDTAQIGVPSQHALGLTLDAECRAASATPVNWAALLLNDGTVEEVFDLTVTGTTGDADARFVAPDGSLLTTLRGIRLPGLAGAVAGLRVGGVQGTFTIALQGNDAATSVTGRVGCDSVTTSTTQSTSTTTTTSSSTTSTTTTSTTTSTTTTSTLPPLGCEFQTRRHTSVRAETDVLADLTVNDPHGVLSIGRKVTMHDGTRAEADRVLIGNDAHLFDVAANILHVARDAVVAGATGPARLPLHPAFCPAVTVDCGTDTVAVTGARTLPPGRYGDLVLDPHASLTLQSGDYVFCSIKAGRDTAVVGPDGGVRVAVAGDVQFGAGSTVADETHPMQVYAGGRRVRFDRDDRIHAFVTAPRARVHVRDRSRLAGGFCSDRSLIGRRVELRCLAERVPQ